MGIIKAVRRGLTAHRLVEHAVFKASRQRRINYKGDKHKVMGQLMAHLVELDQGLQARLNFEKHDYVLDVLVTSEFDYIAVFKDERGIATLTCTLGCPKEFNTEYKGGQFRYRYVRGRLYPLERSRSTEHLYGRTPDFVYRLPRQRGQ